MSEKEKNTGSQSETSAAAEKKEELKETSKPTAEETKTEDKTKNTASEKEEAAEETVFSAPQNTEKTENADTSDEEEIVFAAVDPQPQRKAIQQEETKKRKFPVIPVIAASAVLCIAAAGAIIAVNSNRNTVPVVAQPSIESSAEESLNITSTLENDKKELPSIVEQPIEISEVDTTSIVFGDNVTVEGVNLSGKTLTQAFKAMQDKLLELRDNISISISCDGKTFTLTQDDFKFDTDISSVLIQAYHYSRGELSAPNVETVKNGSVTDFKVTSVINNDSIGGAVKKAAEKFDIQPVNARVTKFDPSAVEKFTYADGSNGFLVDQKELRNKIEEILVMPSKTGSFSINTTETPFTVSMAQIKANTKLIASTYTTAANVWASNYNMELAIKSASGTIVQPGETFSFNAMTGDTTNGSLGYVPSTAIVKGEYKQEYGGGICQASTTLYLCALKADMEVIERWAHAYPSVYADRGLDATVDYGNLDMKFKNNKDYAIYIATYVYDYNGDGLDELLVEIYGPLSTEYDEIVPVGWVTAAGYESYSAKGAKVYFKNGKEIKREYLPSGSYDYKYDTYNSAVNRIPSDPEYGPANVSPTGSVPAVFSPGGCGSSSPIPYGTAAEYLRKAEQESTKPANTQTSQTPQNSQPQQSAGVTDR